MANIGASYASKALGLRFDPAPKYKFYLEIQGIPVAEFDSVTGMTANREVVPYKEGGVNDFTHQFAGHMSYEPITLQRGLTYNPAIWLWFQTGIYDGQAFRPNVTIIVLSADKNIVRHWDFVSAFPTTYNGPDLTAADKTTYAVEKIIFSHHGMFMAPDIRVPWIIP